MIALLLNAGVGSRMGGIAKGIPKALVPIGTGHTILSWQLALLSQQKISKVVITTGQFAQALQEAASQPAYPFILNFVQNPRYLETNYIYSMWLARDLLCGDDVVLLHGDLVLEGPVLSALCAQNRSSMTVDTTLRLPQKDFKARLDNRRICEIGVDLFGKDCVAAQPAYYFKADDFAQWMDEIDTFCARGMTSVYAENALNVRLRQLSLFPLDICGMLCNEIDTPEDYHNISGRFLKIHESRQKAR